MSYFTYVCNIREMFGNHYLEAWEHAENVNMKDDTMATHGRHDSTRSQSAVVIHNAIAQYLNNRNEL